MQAINHLEYLEKEHMETCLKMPYKKNTQVKKMMYFNMYRRHNHADLHKDLAGIRGDKREPDRELKINAINAVLSKLEYDEYLRIYA